MKTTLPMIVKEDPDLSSLEKEVTLRLNKSEQQLVIHSEIGSINRALLTREDFEQTRRRTDADGMIVSLTGTLPMGVLKISKHARSSGSFNSIVSQHDWGSLLTEQRIPESSLWMFTAVYVQWHVAKSDLNNRSLNKATNHWKVVVYQVGFNWEQYRHFCL